MWHVGVEVLPAVRFLSLLSLQNLLFTVVEARPLQRDDLIRVQALLSCVFSLRFESNVSEDEYQVYFHEEALLV